MDEKKMVAYGTAIGMGAVSTIIYLVVNKFGTNPIRKAVAKLRASGKVSPKAALAILAAITSITLPSLVNRGKADAPGTEKFIRDLTRIILNAVPFMFWKEFVHELGLDAQGNPA
ncbi:MAG TPA: hypothetical protein DCP28_15445, partial [Cytophagales bacterium]|nr:hypothetical protein [Cytophagales bacterium]